MILSDSEAENSHNFQPPASVALHIPSKPTAASTPQRRQNLKLTTASAPQRRQKHERAFILVVRKIYAIYLGLLFEEPGGYVFEETLNLKPVLLDLLHDLFLCALA